MDYIAITIAVNIGIYMEAKGVLKIIYTRRFQKKDACDSLNKNKYIENKDQVGVRQYKNKEDNRMSNCLIVRLLS